MTYLKTSLSTSSGKTSPQHNSFIHWKNAFREFVQEDPLIKRTTQSMCGVIRNSWRDQLRLPPWYHLDVIHIEFLTRKGLEIREFSSIYSAVESLCSSSCELKIISLIGRAWKPNMFCLWYISSLVQGSKKRDAGHRFRINRQGGD